MSVKPFSHGPSVDKRKQQSGSHVKSDPDDGNRDSPYNTDNV